MLRLFDHLASGNGYKVRLLLRMLDIPFERVEVDIVRGESRTPEFLGKTPEGRIPVLQLEDGTHLFESNAILCYLAEGTPFLPTHRLDRARVALEQFHRQLFFQVPDLVADGRLRDVQLAPGARQAEMARGGFERAQCIEGRQLHA